MVNEEWKLNITSKEKYRGKGEMKGLLIVVEDGTGRDAKVRELFKSNMGKANRKHRWRTKNNPANTRGNK